MGSIKLLPFEEFDAIAFPPIEAVVYPWLPTRGLGMVAGARGVGKSFWSIGVAYAIATGGSFLGFTAPKPRTVGYVDGEMDPAETQERLRAFEKCARRLCNGDPDRARGGGLGIISHALHEFGIPDLAERANQDALEQALGVREVLILDNISCLMPGGTENSNDAWSAVNDWLVSMRRDGRSTLLVHHTGKPGFHDGVEIPATQRGASKREDPLNVSIVLTRGRTRKLSNLRMAFSKQRRVPQGAERFFQPLDASIEFGDGSLRLTWLDAAVGAEEGEAE